jgi:hypothetical protein
MPQTIGAGIKHRRVVSIIIKHESDSPAQASKQAISLLSDPTHPNMGDVSWPFIVEERLSRAEKKDETMVTIKREPSSGFTSDVEGAPTNEERAASPTVPHPRAHIATWRWIAILAGLYLGAILYGMLDTSYSVTRQTRHGD